MKNLFKNALTYISMVSLVATIVLSAIAIGTVNSSTYRYYKEQYNECSSGYVDCIIDANNASSYYYEAIYEQLADEYSDLMQSWKKRMDKLETRATIFGIASGVCFSSAAVLFVFAVIKSKKSAAAQVAEVPTEEPAIDQEAVAETTAESVEQPVAEEAEKPAEEPTVEPSEPATTESVE